VNGAEDTTIFIAQSVPHASEEKNDVSQTNQNQDGRKSKRKSFEVDIPDLPVGSFFRVKVNVGDYEKRVRLRVPKASNSKRVRFYLDIPEEAPGVQTS